MNTSPVVFRKYFLKTIFYIVIIGGALLAILPFVWMLSSSLKSANEVFKIPIQWIPFPPRWANYSEALSKGDMVLYYLNSIFVSGATVAIRILVCSLAGYGLIKFQFPGRGLIFVFILSTLMIPAEVILVPLFLTVKGLGWLDTYQGLILPLSVSAFGVFIMRQHIQAIPDDLISSARIDGSSELNIFFRIIIPLSAASLVALGIFTFIESWDNLIWPLVIVASDRMKTLTLGIAAFENTYKTNYAYVMAVASVATIPIIITYAIFQRYFIEGITLSGFK
jgi:multiple sugar transport system permease protein